jgi:CDP-diacylglycerol--glycerol-3-phosphate 3-phosphatidyltransferase
MPELKTILLIPNLLTLSRFFLIFPTIYLFSIAKWHFAFASLGILFVTDFFDGYLARKLHQTSNFGAILDPIVDKIVVLSFFLFFYLEGTSPFWYTCIVFLRDLSQLSVVPILIFWKKISFHVKPKLIPKWGTFLNFILLGYYFIIYASSELNFDQIITKVTIFELPLLLLSASIEIYILVTFIPRYIEIFLGKHDTFE